MKNLEMMDIVKFVNNFCEVKYINLGIWFFMGGCVLRLFVN